MSQYITKIRTDKGDLPVDYNALANLPTISNPNLLINSDFRNPVNQRGKTTYSPTGNVLVYTIDRWGIFPSTNDGSGHSVTVNNGYITFANSNANMSAYLIQHLEKPLSGTYTISIKVRSASKTFDLSYRDNGVVSRAMTLNAGVYSATIECTSLNFIRIGVSGVASVDIEWVKLETGSTATLFSPHIFADEVNVCKRYYQEVSSYRFPIIATSSNSAYGVIPIGVSLRMKPSVKIVGATYFDASKGADVSVGSSAPDNTYTTPRSVAIQVTKNSASTFTVGLSMIGTIHATFDAEIY